MVGRAGYRCRSGGGPYSYLPASVEKFPDCEELARWMKQTGFRAVSYQTWTGGVVALHQGMKA